MKKIFAYLIVALMLASMLCACGVDSGDGVVGASPRPTEDMDIIPSMRPDVSPTIIPDAKTTADVGTSGRDTDSGVDTGDSAGKTSPQVGESTGNK